MKDGIVIMKRLLSNLFTKRHGFELTFVLVDSQTNREYTAEVLIALLIVHRAAFYVSYEWDFLGSDEGESPSSTNQHFKQAEASEARKLISFRKYFNNCLDISPLRRDEWILSFQKPTSSSTSISTYFSHHAKRRGGLPIKLRAQPAGRSNKSLGR